MDSWNEYELQQNKKGYLAGGILFALVSALAVWILQIYGTPFLQNGLGPDDLNFVQFVIALGILMYWIGVTIMCLNRYRKISKKLGEPLRPAKSFNSRN